MQATQLESELPSFHGSEMFFRHSLNRSVIWTEGVQFLAENAGAYWLLDEIAIANSHVLKVQAEEFQVWTLTLETIGGAILACGDGNGNTVYTVSIPWTDFPLSSIALYFENNVICLPSER